MTPSCAETEDEPSRLKDIETTKATMIAPVLRLHIWQKVEAGKAIWLVRFSSN